MGTCWPLTLALQIGPSFEWDRMKKEVLNENA